MEQLHLVSQTIIPRLFVPPWGFSLPIKRYILLLFSIPIESPDHSKSLQNIDKAWQGVSRFIREAVAKTRNVSSEETTVNILNSLVSTWDRDSKHGLGEEEIVRTLRLLLPMHVFTSF